MSRLRPLHIPFVQGLDERIDDRLLPDGTLSRLENGRITKAGSLRLRRGWRPIAAASVNADSDSGTVHAIDLYSVNGALVALSDESGTHRTPNLAALLDETSAAAAWRRENDLGLQLPPVTDVRTVGNLAQINGVTRRASSALTADGVYGIVMLQTTAATAKTVYRVFRTEDDTTVVAEDMASGGRTRKVVAAAQKFYLIEHDGSGLELYVLDPAAAAPAWTSVGTLTASATTEFDAVTARVASPAALHVAAVQAGNALYWRASLTTGAVLSASVKTVTATGNVIAVALGTDDSNVTLLYQNSTASGGACKWEQWTTTPPYTTTSGPTDAFLAAETAPGRIACCRDGSSTYLAAGDATAGSPGTNTYYHYLDGASVFIRGTRAATVLTGGFVADSRRGAFGGTRDSAMLYQDRYQPWLVLEHGVGSSSVVTYNGVLDQSGVPFAPGGNVLNQWLVLGNQGDPAADVFPAVRHVKLNSTSRRPGAVLGGRLYLSGGVMSQYAGHEPSESGMLAPVLTASSSSNSTGSLTNSGAYKYRAIVSWTDSRGEVHRSVVSLESSITLGASDDTVTLTYAIPPSMRRNRDLVVDPKLEVYRTEAGPGELFYLAGTAATTPPNVSDSVTFVDTASDASLLDNQRLYTEGETGIGSGQLDVAPPNPAAFVAACRDRIVAGSADPGYQFSQLVLPASPAAFTQPGVSGPVALVYQDSVEGRITGVAALDDTVIIGTAERLYVASASGGPNLAGLGQFESPARLPSDVGFYDARSIVEDSAGLWFLGAQGQLYVLPRGQGVPTFAGEQVQDKLSSGTVVGAARDLQDSITAWAVADGASSRLVWRRAETGQWGSDTLPFVPAALVEHEGRLYAVASDGIVWRQDASAFGDAASGATGYTLVAASGDVQAFGVSGWGRLAALELEAEAESACTVLAEISYDQGETWTSLGAQTVTGAGQIQAQWYPARQRGGKFRVRWTVTPSPSTAEGLRLNGFTIWYTPRNGPTRLDSTRRV